MEGVTSIFVNLAQDLHVPANYVTGIISKQLGAQSVEILVSPDRGLVVMYRRHQLSFGYLERLHRKPFFYFDQLVCIRLLQADSIIIERNNQTVKSTTISHQVIHGALKVVHLQVYIYVLRWQSMVRQQIQQRVFKIHEGCDIDRRATAAISLNEELQDVVLIDTLVFVCEHFDDFGQLAGKNLREDSVLVKKVLFLQFNKDIYLLVFTTCRGNWLRRVLSSTVGCLSISSHLFLLFNLNL